MQKMAKRLARLSDVTSSCATLPVDMTTLFHGMKHCLCFRHAKAEIVFQKCFYVNLRIDMFSYWSQHEHLFHLDTCKSEMHTNYFQKRSTLDVFHYHANGKTISASLVTFSSFYDH